MKHGPIALIDEKPAGGGAVPAGPRLREDALERPGGEGARRPRDRRGRRRATPSSRSILEPHATLVLRGARRCDELWSPLLMVLPLQLLAYHVAVRAGRDVDQPRNLAKSRHASSETRASWPPPVSPLLDGPEPAAARGGAGHRRAGADPGRRRQRQDARHHPPHRPPGAASTGVPAGAILAVTFTNKAAGEMQARVEALLRGAPLAELDLHLPQPLRAPAAPRGGGGRASPGLRDLRRRRPAGGGARGPARPSTSPRSCTRRGASSRASRPRKNSGREPEDADDDSVAAQTARPRRRALPRRS